MLLMLRMCVAGRSRRARLLFRAQAASVLLGSFAACAAPVREAGIAVPPRPTTRPKPLGNPTEAKEAAAVLRPAQPGQGVVAFVGANLLLGTGRRILSGTLLIEDGRISAVGQDIAVPANALVIPAQGRYLSPGLIDTHSHMGVYARPEVAAHADGNEMTDPTTPYVFSEHAFWPQDPAIDNAIAGGVTTIQVLPGSGNVIGGRSTVLKLRSRREARAMRFPGAPFGLKMACGENPKRVYGEKGRQPMSRMGNIFKLRAAFFAAKTYADQQERYARKYRKWMEALEAAQHSQAEMTKEEPSAPPKDLGKETLAKVLRGQILVHIHCYRADEMLQMLSLADELGFRIASFHHATEAYKIADVLAERRVAASVWADWWGFKMEAYDSVEANAAIVATAGGMPVVHSDSPLGIQRLHQEAAKSLYAGRRLGLQLDEDEAIKWITYNPAVALGIDKYTGTLEVGKMGDVVLWDRNPLSIYAQADLVLIDGVVVHDRAVPRMTKSDFDVGTEVEILR